MKRTDSEPSGKASQASILHTLAESVPHRIYAKDTLGRFIFANTAVARGMGLKGPEDLLGRTDFEFYPAESAQQYFAQEQEIISSGRPILDQEEHVKYVLTSEEAWMLTTKVPLRDGRGRVVGIVGINYNITDRKAIERALQLAKQTAEATRDRMLESEDRYRNLVESLPDGLLVAREGLIVFANPAAAALYGASSASDLVGRPVESLVAAPYQDSVPAALDALAKGSNAFNSDEEALRLDGTRLFVSTSRLSIRLGGMPAVQIVLRDISARRKLESHLQYQATHDILTGLPNRALLTDRIEHAISEAARRGGRFQVCFLDLDRFKWINDSLGHDMGDLLLQVVAHRITACLRASDTAARLGGDEFVVLLTNATGEHDVMTVTERLALAIAEPVQLGDRTLTVSCSVGCSHFPEDGASADELMKCADAAMYRSKALGRNQVQIFNVELRQRIDERIHLESELRHALERGQLSLHYQPQVALADGSIVAVEALLRWQHPELGNVAPDRFIPIAEEIGIIIPIGAWVMETACAQMKAWRGEEIAPPRMAINVSAKQLTKGDLPATIRRIVAMTGLEPCELEIELTESASMGDAARTILLMRELKSFGISMSIDDFGTGYSNMGYLRRFPLDRLKLDGTFIRDMHSDPSALAIVEAVVSLSHRLGLAVVAERVETEEQLALLRGCRCDVVQGYYFSRPLPAQACAELLARGPFPVAR